jgi:hypothetical protein
MTTNFEPMKLYQPLLFVGLGGTGCAIGAELERRLREEICGPDGTTFQRLRDGSQPYELPSCVQFVYADFNQADLDRLPIRVVPSERHVGVVHRTAHYVRGLIPQFVNYPQAALSLRMTSDREVAGWLPGEEGEPQVFPLQKGAGQFPTVGRASLFATMRDGNANAVTAELERALHRLAGNSVGEDLFKLSGRNNNANAVDVFVAFSVAGGTGAGIFYDYLHLIGRLFDAHEGLRPQIYPLVLMPSAFEEGKGGGRAAELNAGCSLLDLFRLIDQQNTGRTEKVLHGLEASGHHDVDWVGVRYPGLGDVRMPPHIAQTAFLFSKPLGAESRDLRRSVVSLMLSLIGTSFDPKENRDGEDHQSFADSFINSVGDRQLPAEHGIGRRGVSTAQVASLTVPVDELASIISDRLLREAIEEFDRPLVTTEDNTGLIEDFFTAANIQSILKPSIATLNFQSDAVGAKDVINALGDRMGAIRLELGHLKAKAERTVPDLVTEFNPHGATRDLLGKVDPFRAQRVIFGHAKLPGKIGQLGAKGMMADRRKALPPPRGLTEAPPPMPDLHDGRFGFPKVKWEDPAPRQTRAEQDRWFAWKCKNLWTEPWSLHAPRWLQKLDQVEGLLNDFVRALRNLAAEDREQSGKRAEALYTPRVGICYLLPPGGRFDQFYERVIRYVNAALERDGQVPADATAAQLITALIGEKAWREAFRLAGENTSETAVGLIRERVKSGVKDHFTRTEMGRAPLLPRLADLLAEAAKPTSTFERDYLEEFRAKLNSLVPPDFLPQGGGPLKVLVSYAAPAENTEIVDYLRDSVNLPVGPGADTIFKATSAESITVVLFRSAMDITEVREVREVLMTWAKAVEEPRQRDYLKWRQRTGYRRGYLITTEEQRVHILQRLLCVIWNDKVDVIGDPDSPDVVSVRLTGDVEMPLELRRLRRASSWPDLLRAYELWTFTGTEGIRREFCARLMQETPGVRGQPTEPSGRYRRLRALRTKEIDYLEKAIEEAPNPASRERAQRLMDFWLRTFPAALERGFGDTSDLGSLAMLERDYMVESE